MRHVEVKETSKAMWENIQQRRWDRVRASLRSPIGRKVVQRTHFSGITVLSLAVGYSPPADVVEMMVNINPNAVATQGSRNRFPLHVAAACGASKEVVDILVSFYPQAAFCRDRDGRTPLHYALLSCCGDAGSKQENTSVEAVASIFVAAPCAVEVTDEVNNETPGELACRMSFDSGRWCRRGRMGNNVVSPILQATLSERSLRVSPSHEISIQRRPSLLRAWRSTRDNIGTDMA